MKMTERSETHAKHTSRILHLNQRYGISNCDHLPFHIHFILEISHLS